MSVRLFFAQRATNRITTQSTILGDRIVGSGRGVCDRYRAGTGLVGVDAAGDAESKRLADAGTEEATAGSYRREGMLHHQSQRGRQLRAECP